MMNDLAQKVQGMYRKCTTVDSAHWIQISNHILLQDHQGSNIVKSNPTTHITNIYYLNRSWKSLNHTLKEYHTSFPKYKPQICFPLAMHYLPFPSSGSRVVALSTPYGSQRSTGA